MAFTSGLDLQSSAAVAVGLNPNETFTPITDPDELAERVAEGAIGLLPRDLRNGALVLTGQLNRAGEAIANAERFLSEGLDTFSPLLEHLVSPEEIARIENSLGNLGDISVDLTSDEIAEVTTALNAANAMEDAVLAAANGESSLEAEAVLVEALEQLNYQVDCNQSSSSQLASKSETGIAGLNTNGLVSKSETDAAELPASCAIRSSNDRSGALLMFDDIGRLKNGVTTLSRTGATTGSNNASGYPSIDSRVRAPTPEQSEFMIRLYGGNSVWNRHRHEFENIDGQHYLDAAALIESLGFDYLDENETLPKFATLIAIDELDNVDEVKANIHRILGTRLHDSTDYPEVATLNLLIESKFHEGGSNIIDISPYMEAVSIRTTFENNNYLTGIIQGTLNRDDFWWAMASEPTTRGLFITSLLTEPLVRSFTTYRDDDAPPHMRSAAKAALILEAVMVLPYGRIVKAMHGAHLTIQMKQLAKAIERVDIPTPTEAEVFSRYIHLHSIRRGDEIPWIKVIDTTFDSYRAKILNNVNSKIAASNNLFLLTYTAGEIDSIIATGKSLGYGQHTIEDLIFVGSKIEKRIPAAELTLQMNNYVNVVAKRGFPYKFSSAQDFANYSAEVKGLLSKHGIPIDDIRIQGSSLRTPDAKDVDIAVFVSEDKFLDLQQSMINGINSRASDDAAESIIDDLMTQAATGRINAFYFDRIPNEKTFNQQLYDLLRYMSNSESTDLSIIIKGRSFDISPYWGI